MSRSRKPGRTVTLSEMPVEPPSVTAPSNSQAARSVRKKPPKRRNALNFVAPDSEEQEALRPVVSPRRPTSVPRMAPTLARDVEAPPVSPRRATSVNGGIPRVAPSIAPRPPVCSAEGLRGAPLASAHPTTAPPAGASDHRVALRPARPPATLPGDYQRTNVAPGVHGKRPAQVPAVPPMISMKEAASTLETMLDMLDLEEGFE